MTFINPVTKIVLLITLIFQASSVNIEPKQVRVMAVGDIMMHTPVIYSGYDTETKQYSYDSIFEKVTPIFSEADFVIGNLETPIAGKNLGYSGYPRFNSPVEIATALKNAGVDVLTTANNHSMDKWDDGVIETLNNLDNYGILHTGTFRSYEEKEKPLILEANGIKIGIIANTYGTNGLPVPEDKPYLVNLLDLKTVEEEIKLLKENNVDYIMAMIHFGYEYHRLQSEEQEKWVDDLIDIGVDFVLGSHPHVVQPLKIIEGDEQTSDKGVIYSLGNFLSNQTWDWTSYGIILDITLEKDFKTHKIKIKEISAIPTYVMITNESGKRKYQIIPLIENGDNVDNNLFLDGKELVEHVFQYSNE